MTDTNKKTVNVAPGLLKRISAWYKSLPAWSKRVITIITILIAGYWINPFDFPGPADDVIVTIIGMGAQYFLGQMGLWMNRVMRDDSSDSA